MKKLLLGLLSGAAIGMLFAPEKGSKLRKKLAESDDKLKDFGQEFLAAGKEASAEVQDFIKSDAVQKYISSGKGNLEHIIQEGKTLSLKGKKEVEKIFSTLKGKGEKSDSLLQDISDFFSQKK